MTDYLVYWQSFWNDVDDPAEVVHDWYTKNETFYNQIERGDNLWVVVSGGQDSPGEWRLLQRIYVASRDPHLQQSQYGPYHVIGDEQQGKVFDPSLQPDFAPLLKKLRFASGNRITLSGGQIGQALQSIRRLSDSDVVLLREYAEMLKPI